MFSLLTVVVSFLSSKALGTKQGLSKYLLRRNALNIAAFSMKESAFKVLILLSSI